MFPEGSVMFLEYYRLREQPFGVTPDPRYLYAGAQHRRALAALMQSYESGLGFASLIAEPGLGKTTLLRWMLATTGHSSRNAYMFETQCDSRGMLRHLLCDLDSDPPESDMDAMFRTFRDLTVTTAKSGRRLLLIIDEAQNLQLSVLETIRLLSNFETHTTKLVHIVLAGQPELAKVLALPELQQLRQRINTNVYLQPLSTTAVTGYVEHRLRIAGYGGSPLFTPEALALVADQSRGIPREINRICFNAMSLCCALKKRTIDESAVRDAVTGVRTGPLRGTSPDGPSDLPAPDEASLPSIPPSRPGAQAIGDAFGTLTAVIQLGTEENGPVPDRNRMVAQRAPERLAASEPAPKGPDRKRRNHARRIQRRDRWWAGAGFIVLATAIAFSLKLMPRSSRQSVPANGDTVQAGTPPLFQHGLPSMAKRENSHVRRTDISKRSPAGPMPTAALSRGQFTEAQSMRRTRNETPAESPRAGTQAFEFQALDRPPPTPLKSSEPALSEAPPIAIHSKVEIPTFAASKSEEPALRMPGHSDAGAGADTGLKNPDRALPGTLLVRAVPQYPDAAKQAHITGSVVLRAHVDTKGRVTSVQAIKGNILLADAAAHAVRSWVYSPFMSAGHAVEADTTVIVSFVP